MTELNKIRLLGGYYGSHGEVTAAIIIPYPGRPGHQDRILIEDCIYTLLANEEFDFKPLWNVTNQFWDMNVKDLDDSDFRKGITPKEILAFFIDAGWDVIDSTLSTGA